jgi:phage gp36-like protein
LRQFTDDDRSGAPDKPVVKQVIKDASSMVWSYIGDVVTIPDSGVVPDYLIKLTLDVAQGLVYTRIPNTVLASQGFAMIQLARSDLQRVAEGMNKVTPPGGGTTSSTPVSADAANGVVMSTPIRGNYRGGHF